MMNTMLGLKLAVVPLLIGAVTLAGRRWGPGVAGWLSGFPIVTGPILVFIALDQGGEFGASAALATLAGLPAILAFNLAYAWTSMRATWPASLAAAIGAYVVAVNVFVALNLPAPLLLALVAVMLRWAPRLFPPVASAVHNDRSPFAPASLVGRMLAAALLVWSVTHFAEAMGPRWSGALAMFPMVSMVMAPFSHRQSGNVFTVLLLRGVILGWYALVAFCLLLHVFLLRMHMGAAILLAAGGALLVQAASRFLSLRTVRD